MRGFYGRLAVFVLAAGCLLSRDPMRLFAPQLWAEDGPVWLAEAYMRGLSALARPHTGYLQTLPRLVALPAVLFPLAWAPVIFAGVGYLIQLVPVVLLLSRRGAVLVQSALARLCLVAFYIGVPNSFETFINLTDAQWHFAIIMFLLVVLPAPEMPAGRIGQAVALLIGGLSGPFSVFLAPLAWWQSLSTPGNRRFWLQPGVLTAAAAVQSWLIVEQLHGSRRIMTLGASFGGLARLVDLQIFLGGIAGARWSSRLSVLPFWNHNDFAAALVFGLALAVVALGFALGPAACRKFIIYAALIIAAALVSPVASGNQPQWLALQVPGAGSRYYLIPILAWFAAILVLAGDSHRAIRWPARLLLLASLVGVVSDWRYASLLPTSFQQTARRFDAVPAGTVMRFAEDPDPDVWNFVLTKK